MPKAKQYKRAARLLNVTAALLVLLLIAAVNWHQADQRAQLDIGIKALVDSAEKANIVSKELAALKRTSGYVNGKLNRIPRLTLLNELARRLPDSSWLSDLRIADDELTVSGNAVGATTLVKALEVSPMLENPHFVAPIYGWRDGTEHFEMAIHIKDADPRP